MAHFHHLSICNQNQSTSIWSFFFTIPRLEPYFLATTGSFSSLFNLQSKSINFKFGHFSAKYQGQSLTFSPTMAHFHHFSICNQNQSISILVIYRQNTKVIALLFPQKWLIFITFQSAIKINQFQVSVIFRQNTKVIALLFPHKWLNFHHFSICNQNQSMSIWSFFFKIPRLEPYFFATTGSFSSLFNLHSKSINFNFGHFSAKYQGYSLTFSPTMAHFHHFSICNQNQSISIWSFFGKIQRLEPYFFAKTGSFSSLFNLQSKSINFNFGHFSAKYQGLQPYFFVKNCSLSSLFNWLIFIQSKSINFNFGHFSAKYQGYSLTFSPKMAHFHHFSICNQNQSISSLVIFRQNTKVIALLFRQTWLIFITFQSAIKINQFQFSPKMVNHNFSILVTKYQGYSLTFSPNMAHFHHFSICNQNQSISILVIFRQTTKVIALLFRQKWLIFITFQSAIKINQFQFWSFFFKIPKLYQGYFGKPYFFPKNGSCSSLVNLQSKSINFNFGHFSSKYQGQSLTLSPNMAHFHHFSICNQNQSISILVIVSAHIPRLQIYFFAKHGSFSSLFNLQSKSINFKFGHFSANIQRLQPYFFANIWLIFITFQSAIKINQFQFWSFIGNIPRLQPYFFPKNGSFSSLFNLQSKSINVKFGHVIGKIQS